MGFLPLTIENFEVSHAEQRVSQGIVPEPVKERPRKDSGSGFKTGYKMVVIKDSEAQAQLSIPEKITA